MLWNRNGVFEDGSSPRAALATRQTIAMRIKDEVTVFLTIKRANGAPKDLTNAKVVATLYGRIVSGFATLVATTSFGSDDQTQHGQVEVVFPAAAFAAFMLGAAQWDVWITDAAGVQVQVVPKSDVTIIPADRAYPALDGDQPSAVSLAAAKGDLQVFDGKNFQRLPAGDDGQALRVKNSAPLGIDWENNAPSTGGTGFYYPKDFGAVGDGVTDDSAAIQAMLVALFAGVSGVVCWLDKATNLPLSFKLTSVIVDYANAHLSPHFKFIGGGSTIIDGGGPGTVTLSLLNTGGDGKLPLIDIEELHFISSAIATQPDFVLRVTGMSLRMANVDFQNLKNGLDHDGLVLGDALLQHVNHRRSTVNAIYNGGRALNFNHARVDMFFCNVFAGGSLNGSGNRVYAINSQLRVHYSSYIPFLDSTCTGFFADESGNLPSFSGGAPVDAFSGAILVAGIRNGIRCQFLLGPIPTAGLLYDATGTLIQPGDDPRKVIFVSLGAQTIVCPGQIVPILDDGVTPIVAGDKLVISGVNTGSVTKRLSGLGYIAIAQGPANGNGYVLAVFTGWQDEGSAVTGLPQFFTTEIVTGKNGPGVIDFGDNYVSGNSTPAVGDKLVFVYNQTDNTSIFYGPGGGDPLDDTFIGGGAGSLGIGIAQRANVDWSAKHLVFVWFHPHA